MRSDSMSTQTLEGSRGSSIEAPLKYLADRRGVSVYIASVGGGDTTRHEGDYVLQPVTIHNGRCRAEGFSLEREGFTLVSSPSAVADFYDDAQIAAVYEAEAKALVREVTGAARVEIFDHTRRSTSLDGAEGTHAFASRPRSSTTTTRPARGRSPLCATTSPRATRTEAEALLRRRFAIINLWRSIRGRVLTAPLALCDAASVAPEDLVPVERRAKARIGEIQQAVHSPAHRWYYFPDMGPEEVLLIKTFDSETDGRARFTIHSAFEDPTSPPDAPPRESLETRCFAFF